MKKDILQDIIANKRIEVARQKQAVSLQTLLALGSDRMKSVTHVPCVRRWNHPPPVLSPSSSVKAPPRAGCIRVRISPTWCPLTRPEEPPPARSLRTGISSEVPWATCKRPASWWISRYFDKDFIIDTYQLFKPG